MSFVEIKDFNVLLDNKPFLDQPVKSFLNRKETMTIQQETCQNNGSIKNVINFLAQIYQDKQIQLFLTKLIL